MSKRKRPSKNDDLSDAPLSKRPRIEEGNNNASNSERIENLEEHNQELLTCNKKLTKQIGDIRDQVEALTKEVSDKQDEIDQLKDEHKKEIKNILEQLHNHLCTIGELRLENSQLNEYKKKTEIFFTQFQNQIKDMHKSGNVNAMKAWVEDTYYKNNPNSDSIVANADNDQQRNLQLFNNRGGNSDNTNNTKPSSPIHR
jgi:chromosome segregation ATPase